MSTPAPAEAVATPAPAPTTSRRTGRGSRDNRNDKYRQKKNAAFAQQNDARLHSVLHRNPTSVTLDTNCPVVFAPVTFYAIPAFLRTFWRRLSAKAPRALSILLTEQNFKVFVKIVLYMLEAKLISAQTDTTFNAPRITADVGLQTLEDIRTLVPLTKSLPVPVARIIDALGCSELSGMRTIPRFSIAEDANARALDSQAPTLLRPLLAQFLLPQPDVPLLRNALALFPIEWVVANGNMNINANSVLFTEGPTAEERAVFASIMSGTEGKYDLAHADIQTGEGSPLLNVRTSDSITVNTTDLAWYATRQVPEVAIIQAAATGFSLDTGDDLISPLQAPPGARFNYGTIQYHEAVSSLM